MFKALRLYTGGYSLRVLALAPILIIVFCVCSGVMFMLFMEEGEAPQSFFSILLPLSIGMVTMLFSESIFVMATGKIGNDGYKFIHSVKNSYAMFRKAYTTAFVGQLVTTALILLLVLLLNSFGVMTFIDNKELVFYFFTMIIEISAMTLTHISQKSVVQLTGFFASLLISVVLVVFLPDMVPYVPLVIAEALVAVIVTPLSLVLYLRAVKRRWLK